MDKKIRIGLIMVMAMIISLVLPLSTQNSNDQNSQSPNPSTFNYDTTDGNVNVDVDSIYETVESQFDSTSIDIGSNWNLNQIDCEMTGLNDTSSLIWQRGISSISFEKVYSDTDEYLASQFMFNYDVYLDNITILIDDMGSTKETRETLDWFNSSVTVGIQDDTSENPSGNWIVSDTINNTIWNATTNNPTGEQTINDFLKEKIDNDITNIQLPNTTLTLLVNDEFKKNTKYWFVIESPSSAYSASIGFGFGQDGSTIDKQSIDGGSSWSTYNGDMFLDIEYQGRDMPPTYRDIKIDEEPVGSNGLCSILGDFDTSHSHALDITSNVSTSNLEWNLVSNVSATRTRMFNQITMDYDVVDDGQVTWNATDAITKTSASGTILSHTMSLNTPSGWSSVTLDSTADTGDVWDMTTMTSPFDLTAQSSDIITAMTINDNNVDEGSAITGSLTASQTTNCDVKLLDSSDSIVSSHNGIKTDDPFSLDTTGLSEGYYKIYAIAEDGANGHIGFEENNTWVYINAQEEPTTVDYGDAELAFTFDNGDKINNLEWVRIENSTWDNTYYSESDGNFTITDLEYGTYDVVIRYDGQTYLLEEVTITIDNDVVYATVNSGIDASTTSDGTTNGTNDGGDESESPSNVGINGFPIWMVGVMSVAAITVIVKRKK